MVRLTFFMGTINLYECFRVYWLDFFKIPVRLLSGLSLLESSLCCIAIYQSKIKENLHPAITSIPEKRRMENEK